MLSLRISLSVLVSLLAANAVMAAPDLKVRVTGPTHIQHTKDLRVVSTIINTGDTTLKLLHDPHGLLSSLPANKFTIINHQNLQPKFTGIRAKFVPTIAAESGAYTTLEPGQSVEVEHDLSKAYDFSTSGAGEYAVHARGCFYIIDAFGEILALRAETEHHIAKISGKSVDPKRDDPAIIGKNARFSACSASQESQITSSLPLAERYAKNALSYLQGYGNGTPRYSTWFGEYQFKRHDTVLSHFEKMSENLFVGLTFDCSCSEHGVFAFVYPNQFGKIHLCDNFWQAPTSGTDSKAGTLIHEISHFAANGGTSDIAYGQEAAEELAHDDPDDAVNNADSYEYFAENYPALD